MKTPLLCQENYRKRKRNYIRFKKGDSIDELSKDLNFQKLQYLAI